MTVSSTTSRNQYTATSGQTVFPYSFEIFDKDDVAVLQNGTLLSEGTNYTVSGVGNNSGGNITLVVGATAGDVLTIYRDMAYQRLTDYQNSGDFLAQEVNDDFDRLWLAVQQNEQGTDRAIVKPITDASSIDMTLPSATDRANSFLTFDSTGAPSVIAAGSINAPSSIIRQQFTGDGSTVLFTLAVAPGALGQSVQVFIDGVYQEGDTYTISGASLTFSESPPLNSSIEVVTFKVNDIGETSSNLVSYISAGSVETSVQAKLRETVSPADFGAVGDGVTDDTAALQAMADYVFSVSTVLDTSLRKGHVKVEFPPRREYKITDTIDFGGSIGTAGQQGCRVNIDFNNCQISPAPDGSGVVHSALRLWGLNAKWQNLTIDFGVHCTQHQVYSSQPAGIVMNPLEANVPASGVIFSFCTYQQIIVFNAWIGFYLEPDTAPSFKNRFINCDAKGCLNWGYKMDSSPDVGISTTNVWECCHVAAKLAGSDVANGGLYYNCIQTHVPSAATEPGVGADWQNVWIENTATSGSGYPAWSASETRYYEDGKGYYLYALSNSTFQGGCAVDGTNNGENGNMITVDNQGGLVIMGGLHVEGYLSAFDNKYPIDVPRGYLFIDELYFPGCFWMAPTENILIGSSRGQGRRVFLQDYYDYAPTIKNTPIRAIDATGINFVQTGMGIASDEVIGTPDNGALIERRIVSRDMYQTGLGATNVTITPTVDESGTYYAHNIGSTGSATLQLNGNYDQGTFYKVSCFNSTGAATGTALVTGINGSVIHGPTEAVNGQTICARKIGTTLWQTWIEPTKNTDGDNSYNSNLGVMTVNDLPTAAAGYTGARAMVTDANATTFASTVASGGANTVPVYCDGSNWIIG